MRKQEGREQDGGHGQDRPPRERGEGPDEEAHVEGGRLRGQGEGEGVAGGDGKVQDGDALGHLPAKKVDFFF